MVHAGMQGGLRDRLFHGRFGRRRRILVNPRYQIRTALLGVTGMGFLVALTAVLDSQLKARSSRMILEGAPFLRETLAATNRREIVLVVAAGALFMVAVFLAGILESRKTAGPILNLRRRLEELRAGRLGAKVILRRQDNFPELAGAFNEMAGAIRARAEGELATSGAPGRPGFRSSARGGPGKQDGGPANRRDDPAGPGRCPAAQGRLAAALIARAGPPLTCQNLADFY